MPDKPFPKYQIVSVTPGILEDEERLVEQFDRKADAEIVLQALESVNMNFNVYKLKTVEINRRTA